MRAREKRGSEMAGSAPSALHEAWSGPTNERRVVLLDLDGTLMDSSRAWKEAATRALSELRLNMPAHCTTKAALAGYSAIYSCHSLITGLLGPRGHAFEDMRQEWNTRTSYALLLALLEKPQCRSL